MRKKLNRRANRKSFKSGVKTHKRNFTVGSQRGGTRL